MCLSFPGAQFDIDPFYHRSQTKSGLRWQPRSVAAKDPSHVIVNNRHHEDIMTIYESAEHVQNVEVSCEREKNVHITKEHTRKTTQHTLLNSKTNISEVEIDLDSLLEMSCFLGLLSQSESSLSDSYSSVHFGVVLLVGFLVLVSEFVEFSTYKSVSLQGVCANLKSIKIRKVFGCLLLLEFLGSLSGLELLYQLLALYNLGKLSSGDSTSNVQYDIGQSDLFEICGHSENSSYRLWSVKNASVVVNNINDDSCLSLQWSEFNVYNTTDLRKFAEVGNHVGWKWVGGRMSDGW
mmetsp:Transcript_10376/g.38481  ORF Transcript_10376/g.38481 Transcript_10376/m.38481 type:complete len:293 (-) Transcript_10376:23-901(-)